MYHAQWAGGRRHALRRLRDVPSKTQGCTTQARSDNWAAWVHGWNAQSGKRWAWSCTPRITPDTTKPFWNSDFARQLKVATELRDSRWRVGRRHALRRLRDVPPKTQGSATQNLMDLPPKASRMCQWAWTVGRYNWHHLHFLTLRLIFQTFRR